MQNAGLLRRLAAIVYDLLLVVAVLFMATVPFIAVRGGEPVEPDGNLVYQLTIAATIYAFFVFFWSWRGRTLGMQAWRIQLETMDGKRPDFRIASVRFLAAVVSLLPLGLGFLWQLWDRDKLAWHDRLSGTRVRYYPKQ